MRRPSIATWACLCLLGLVAGCKADRPGPSLGSDTNWLRACSSDGQCDSSACRCGVCTRSCRQAADCGAAAAGRLCIEAGELSETSCRLAFSEASSGGFCSQPCTRHTDCGPSGGSAVFCIEGTCLPGGATTPRGSVASVAADAGVAISDAALSDTALSDTALSDAALSMEDAAPAIDPVVADAGRLRGPSDVVGPGGFPFEVPNPQPECPCQSDLSTDVPLPAQGEVATNAYGGPQPPTEPSDSPLEGGSSYLRCADVDSALWWWFSAETDCVRYENCSIVCTSDADCPNGGSGSAAPRCSTTGFCYLDCQQERACPDGMACVSGQDGAACYWPREVLAPGCAAYCRQSPPPRDCDNWCADLLVACDPDNGVSCCEGLSCTAGGYCDEAP